MSLINSVDTSFYSELIEGFAPKSLHAISGVDENTQTKSLTFAFNDNTNTDTEIDLNYYYEDKDIENWFLNIGNNVINSAKNLNKTIMTAIQNGYSVQDACNIRLAETAYKANAHVFSVANEISTFTLDV